MVTARHKVVLAAVASGVVLIVVLAATVLVLRAGGPGDSPSRAAATGDPGTTADADGAGTGASAPASASGTPSAGTATQGAGAATPSPSTTSTAPTARAAPPADNAASRLRTLPAATRQVIVVSADNFNTSGATFETFTKTAGGWQPAFGAMTARLGVNGFGDQKIEGDLQTPTGVYSIGSTMYGIAANPGVKYAYHRLVPDDYWNENPATAGYNTFFHGPNPGGASEALWEISPQYRYFAVINYNTPVVPANPPRGSGIFLHVFGSGATAGCVALSESDLVRVLRWLDPAAAPRIVLAPRSALSRY
jgi:L,D-peptidoglycan transpeptidase YkuD (ErfK/YbiS/YcfS/YnhG family)